MHARRERVRQEAWKRVLPGALVPRLVEAVHDEYQALSARDELMLRHPGEKLDQPVLRPRLGVLLRWVERLDLRREGARDRLGAIPVHDVAPEEVVRRPAAALLLHVEPSREDRALAHAGPARDEHPAA
ncbi:hypothetical protein WME82_20075 [Sorangium sp. So ce128]